MSVASSKRFAEAYRQAFRNLLSKWLLRLPDDGRELTVSELRRELRGIRQRIPLPVPGPTGLGQRLRREIAFIEECGVMVEFRQRGDRLTVLFLPCE